MFKIIKGRWKGQIDIRLITKETLLAWLPRRPHRLSELAVKPPCSHVDMIRLILHDIQESIDS